MTREFKLKYKRGHVFCQSILKNYKSSKNEQVTFSEISTHVITIMVTDNYCFHFVRIKNDYKTF